jgi:uncharacterized membrane protein YcaP (DUF421 family)
MEIFIKIFGEGKDLSALQMSARALVVYILALIFIRISGRRTFGKKSSFDTTITIILGAVLSRAITGASAFIPTIACSLLLVLIHRFVAWMVTYNKAVGKILKGERRSLYKNDRIEETNLRKALMTYDDLMSDVRLKTNEDSLDNIEEIHMESSGELSVIKKKN